MALPHQCLAALLLCAVIHAATAATVKLSFEMSAADNYFNDNAAKAFEARKLIRTIMAAPGSPATALDVTGCSEYDSEGPHNACLVLVQTVQLPTGPAHVTVYATVNDDANWETALQNSAGIASTIDAAMTAASIAATATASTFQVGADQGPVESETVTYTMDVAGADVAALTAQKAAIATHVSGLASVSADKVLVRVSASSPSVVAIATVNMGSAAAIVAGTDTSAATSDIQTLIGGGSTVSNFEVGEDINLVIGAYGPMTADAYQVWLSTFASFDVDFRSNYDAELASRTGGPIIHVPNLHPRLRLKLQLATDHAQKQWAVQSALDYWHAQNGMQNIHGLIGGYHSAFSKPIAAIGNTLSNAQVSFGSTNAALSIKSDYGYFFRTIPEDSIQSAAMWNWVKFFEIPKFLSLYGDDGAYAAGLSRGVQENAVQDEQLFRMQAIRVPDPLYVSDGCKVDAEIGEPAALAAARTAKESGVKFMMICQANPEWGCLAEQLRAEGLLGPNAGVQYLGSEALKSTTGNPLPSGFMQFQPSNRDSGDIFTPNFVNLWSKMTADDVYGKLAQEYYKANRWYVPWEQMSTPYIFDKDEYDKTLEGPYSFDAGYTYIMAFNALIQSGKTLDSITSEELLATMQATDFTGITGVIQFNANQDRIGDNRFMNVKDDSVAQPVTEQVGLYSASSQEFTISENPYWVNQPGAESLASRFPPAAMTACSVNFYVNDQGLCTKCLPGQYSPGGAATSCTACPKGSFQEFTDVGDASACTPCATGTFAFQASSTQCDECPAGKFAQSTGSSECTFCAVGQFQPLPGKAFCTWCGSGSASSPGTKQPLITTAFQGLSNAADCVCKEGYYSVKRAFDSDGNCTVGPCVDHTQLECKACPEGMTCETGASEANFVNGGLGKGTAARTAEEIRVRNRYPKLDEGFFTEKGSPLSVYECPRKNDGCSCPGGDPGTCAEDRSGVVCSKCPSGYRMTECGCTECEGATYGLLAVVIICLLGGTIALYYFANSPFSAKGSISLTASIYAGITVTVLQLLSMMSELNLPWPTGQSNVLAALSVFAGSADALSAECMLSSDPVALFVFRCTLPCNVCVFVFVCWAIFQVVGLAKPELRWDVNKTINTVGAIIQTLFILVVVIATKPFHTYQHPNGEASTILSPGVITGSDAHNSMITFGAVVFVTVVIPFSAVTIYGVMKAPAMANDVGFITRNRFLLYRFRPEAWWWGAPLLIRQILLALSSTIPADDLHMQSSYVVFILGLFLIFQMKTWPWKNSELNYFEGSLLLLVLFLSKAATAFMPLSFKDDTHSRMLWTWLSILALEIVGFGVMIIWATVKSGSIFAEFSLGSTDAREKRPRVLAGQWWKMVTTITEMDAKDVADIVGCMNGYDHIKMLSALNAWNAAAPKLIGSVKTGAKFDVSQERMKAAGDMVDLGDDNTI